MSLDGFSSEAAQSTGPLPQPGNGSRGQARSSQFDEWQKAHAALLAEEQAFSEAVLGYARGELAPEQLEVVRKKVRAVQALADAVFQRAFGIRGGAS